LADLRDPQVLHQLLGTAESDLVERKRTADARTLAKVVSAFANANGGWVLLGVEDDGSLSGWRPKGRAHPRDWLRDVLDNMLDPLPQFEAELFDFEGTSVGVVRVLRSSLKPHFIDGTGEVFVRRNGQTRRLTGSEVREMMLQTDGSIEAAAGRFGDRNKALDVAIALDAPRESTAMPGRALASILRISPVETSAGFTEWVYSPEAFARSHSFVRSAARSLNDRDWRTPPEPPPARTTAGGHLAAAEWDGRILREVAVAWDRSGIGGVRLAGERPDDSGVFYLLSDQVRDTWLAMKLRYVFACVLEAGAVGPAALRRDLYGVRGADVTTVVNDRVVAAQGVIPAHYNNMVAIDAEVDLGVTSADDVAGLLWQQLERLSGAQRL
jgi:hypothetical protein